MNKTQRIQKLNQHTQWAIKYLPTDIISPKRDYGGTLDALRVARDHWSNIETGTNASTNLPYSKLLSDAINLFEEYLSKIDDTYPKNAPQIIQSISSEYAIQLQFSNIRLESGAGVLVTIPINVLPLMKDKQNLLDYAYKELYFQDLTNEFQTFINMAVRGEAISNNLNSSQSWRIDGAIHYLSARAASINFPNKNQVVDNQIRDVNAEISAAKKSLLDLRSEAEEFINAASAEYTSDLSLKNSEYENMKGAFEVWYQEKLATIKTLEETYLEYLQLEAPVKFWNEQAQKKRDGFKFWLKWTSIVSGLLVCFVTTLFIIIYSQPEGALGQMIPLSFIVVALIALLIYAVKTLVKITITERHLSTEFEEKAMYTHFYLSLMKDSGVSLEKEEKLLIYNAIFSKIDSGLIKASGDSELGAKAFIKTFVK